MTPNKTDAGNGSYGICRVIDASRAPSPDPSRSAEKMNRVSRTYTLSYELPDSELKKLRAVYERLPGFFGFNESECPMWFGREEEGRTYLWASVEPSGLLVEGVLDHEAWQQWDAAFRAGASRALGFEVKDADE